MHSNNVNATLHDLRIDSISLLGDSSFGRRTHCNVRYATLAGCDSRRSSLGSREMTPESLLASRLTVLNDFIGFLPLLHPDLGSSIHRLGTSIPRGCDPAAGRSYCTEEDS
jgi:hypothetical protein